MIENKELNLFKDLILALKGKLRPNSVINLKVAVNKDSVLTEVWEIEPGKETRLLDRKGKV